MRSIPIISMILMLVFFLFSTFDLLRGLWGAQDYLFIAVVSVITVGLVSVSTVICWRYFKNERNEI